MWLWGRKENLKNYICLRSFLGDWRAEPDKTNMFLERLSPLYYQKKNLRGYFKLKKNQILVLNLSFIFSHISHHIFMV